MRFSAPIYLGGAGGKWVMSQLDINAATRP